MFFVENLIKSNNYDLKISKNRILNFEKYNSEKQNFKNKKVQNIKFEKHKNKEG